MIIGDYTYGAETIKVNRFGPKNLTGPHPWSDSRARIGKFCSVGRFCNIYIPLPNIENKKTNLHHHIKKKNK